ncbi:uncharacterized protein LOC131153933 [Malania oleifera]|uniref:uncharacterized protein LOC131153933 n=1 Tax=Malania oleifera TaxID=397392 RepID=UPI0025ADCAB3|nr:uncharacterized protein LOC131153933 [Malania oleifera]
MEQLFTDHFLSSCRIVKTSAHLMSMVQGEMETLKKFMHHFIRNLDMGVALAALTTVFQPRNFLYSLGKKPPTDMGELMARAQKYINLEEMMDTRGNQIKLKRKGSSQENGKLSRPAKKQEASTLHTSSKMRGQPNKFSTYTPLNAPWNDMLMHIRKKEYVLWPIPMRTPSYKWNMTKFYPFHRDHEHDTEECIQLKNEIEALIKKGYLLRFIKKGDRQRETREQKNPNRDKKEEHIIGEIAVIFGGFASGRDNEGARKNMLSRYSQRKKGNQAV